MQRYYIIEGLFILLGIGLLVTAIKYPKDIFVKLPLAIINLLLKRLWWIVSLPLTILAILLLYVGEKFNWKIAPTIKKFLDSEIGGDDDKPYPSTKNLRVDFKNGAKYAYVLNSTKDLKGLIIDFLEVLTGKYSIEEFLVADNGSQKILQFPAHINFYDYHLLIQHLHNELGDRKSFGVYKSDKLNYYVFQDCDTLNNLIGFTSDKKLFSIYMLANLKRKQNLRLNQKLKVDTDWIEDIKARATNQITSPTNEF